MAKEYKLSPQRLKELRDEMNYLKTVREKEVAELIKEARSFGDLSENSEYDEAKNEQGKLYSRMAELEEILSNYVVIEEEEKTATMSAWAPPSPCWTRSSTRRRPTRSWALRRPTP